MIVDIPRKRRFPYRPTPIVIKVRALDAAMVEAAIRRDLGPAANRYRESMAALKQAASELGQ